MKGNQGTLSGFENLKALKKELEAEEKEAAKQGASASEVPQQPRKSKTVQLKSIHEEHARNEGYVRGQAVRMMDTNDEGTITGFRKDCFEITFKDGFMVTAAKGEFVLIDKEEDKLLYRSMPSAPKKKQLAQERRAAADGGPMKVDLHMEWIPGNENVPDWAALDFQMDYFRRVLRENLKHRGKKIVFIHGIGDGSLRDAIRKELDETFALSTTYQAGTVDNYGSGTIIVTIR